tara:strand:+ start:374 stop:877 length:504 start_codon:yes stop_codon:yes gene_type:complete
MNFIADLESEISVTLTTSEKDDAFHDWAHTAWYTGCEYILTNYSTKITKGSVAADGTLSSGDDAYWGLDHIKTGLRTKIKTDTSLFAYYGVIPNNTTKNKFFVVTDGNIYRFETATGNGYFNAAKSSLINYTAAEYYYSVGNSTAGDSSNTDGNSTLATYVDEHISE